MIKKSCCVICIVAALLISADTLSDLPEEDADDSVRASKACAEDSGGTVPTLGPGIQRLVDLATADLASKLGIDEEAVEVVEAQYVTWRDSSAGCPKPSMQYLQVLTNGARIVLRADETDYHYHSGGRRAPFHCANPSPTAPLPYSHGES